MLMFSKNLSKIKTATIINDKIIQNAGNIKEELKIFEDLDTMFNRSLLILLEILNNLLFYETSITFTLTWPTLTPTNGLKR